MKFISALAIFSSIDIAHGQYGGTPRPTTPPTTSPTTCEIPCEHDYDCPRICHKHSIYDPVGTCVTSAPVPTPPPIRNEPTTPAPTECRCEDPSPIPDECEVRILIDMLDTAVIGNHRLLPQWTRAAFHDAGTFDQNGPEGGANGCLLTHPPMRLEPENAFLDPPLNTLQAVMDAWHASPFTCINVSHADMLQFAIFYATVRQSGNPDTLLSTLPLTASANAKINKLITEFLWGRSDEPNCDTVWTHNLPGFTTPSSGGPIPGRCAGAGQEIEDKMMNRNGFTDEEATVLIGAHTIGMLRNTFGPGLASPWVLNGLDNATPNGPVFDKAFHHFLINDIVAPDLPTFASAPPGSTAPFNQIFPDWFRDSISGVGHLDTDVTLAFTPTAPPVAHPDYSVFTTAFAANNNHFLTTFFEALQKMSRLGVTDPLFSAGPCEPPCPDAPDGGITLESTVRLVKDIGNATAWADEAIRKVQEQRKDEINEKTTEVVPPHDDTTQPTEWSGHTQTESTARDDTTQPTEWSGHTQTEGSKMTDQTNPDSLRGSHV